jgi:hypothetical protein
MADVMIRVDPHKGSGCSRCCARDERVGDARRVIRVDQAQARPLRPRARSLAGSPRENGGL